MGAATGTRGTPGSGPAARNSRKLSYWLQGGRGIVNTVIFLDLRRAMRGMLAALSLGALCTPLLLGCTSPSDARSQAEARAAIRDYQDDATCRGRHLHEGSPEYARCRAELARQEREGWLSAFGSP